MDKKFLDIIRAIRSGGEALDKLVLDGISHIATRVVLEGNTGAGNQWDVLRQASPDYARRIIDTARKACNAIAKAGQDVDDRLEIVLLSARENLRGRRLKLSNAQTANRAKAREAREAREDAEREERIAKYTKAIASKPSNPRAQARANPRNKVAAVANAYVLKGVDTDPLELSAEEYKLALKAVMDYRAAKSETAEKLSKLVDDTRALNAA